MGWTKPVPYNPYELRNVRWGGAAWAIAGPGSNFLIAIFAAVCIRFINSTAFLVLGVPESFAMSLFNFFQILAFVNIILGIFNLIPIPPLDGSKLLSAVLPESGRKFMNFLESLGPIFIFFILIFIFRATGPYWANLIGRIYGFLIGA